MGLSRRSRPKPDKMSPIISGLAGGQSLTMKTQSARGALLRWILLLPAFLAVNFWAWTLCSLIFNVFPESWMIFLQSTIGAAVSFHLSFATLSTLVPRSRAPVTITVGVLLLALMLGYTLLEASFPVAERQGPLWASVCVLVFGGLGVLLVMIRALQVKDSTSAFLPGCLYGMIGGILFL